MGFVIGFEKQKIMTILFFVTSTIFIFLGIITISEIAMVYNGWYGKNEYPYQIHKPKYKNYFRISALLSVLHLNCALELQWPSTFSGTLGVITVIFALSIIYFSLYKIFLKKN